MLALILSIITFVLFLVGITLVLIDLYTYKPNPKNDTDTRTLPKLSKYSMAFALSSLLVMVFLSFT